jgi:putative hydrolase of the HAD superfamily
VTSARVGARKPHAKIYAAITELLGVRAAETLFVGDSLHPDVTGPLALGMRAAHVWRETGTARQAPPLPAGAGRVAAVVELLAWPLLATAAVARVPDTPRGTGGL